MDINTLAMLPPQVLAAYLRDPNTMLATNFQKEGTDTSPVKSPWEGLARVAKAGLGAYMANKLQSDYGEKGKQISDERKDALSLALGKPAETKSYGDTTINWNAQKPNYAAAMGMLGGGNQDLQDALLSGQMADQRQEKGSDLALRNAMTVAKYGYENDPEKQLNQAMIDLMRGGQGSSQVPESMVGQAIPQMPMSQLGMPVQQSQIPPPPPPMQMPQRDAAFMPPQGQPQMPTAQGQPPMQPPPMQQQGFNPVGAMLAKKMGLDGMQIGAGGQLSVVPGMSQVESNAAQAKAEGKDAGEAAALLSSMESRLPQLMGVVTDLNTLGQSATYTPAGRALDSVIRGSGFEPRQGAIDATAYQAKISNEILPLLRDTFGAQFTEREGESLKATLGDPSMSPPEKTAVLEAFIKTKIDTIKSMQRRLGRPETDAKPPDLRNTPLPPGVTEEDIDFTAKKYGLTREQVIQKLNGGRNAP